MLPCKEWESVHTRQFRHTARVGMSAGTEVRCVCSCVCVLGDGGAMAGSDSNCHPSEISSNTIDQRNEERKDLYLISAK